MQHKTVKYKVKDINFLEFFSFVILLERQYYLSSNSI